MNKRVYWFIIWLQFVFMLAFGGAVLHIQRGGTKINGLAKDLILGLASVPSNGLHIFRDLLLGMEPYLVMNSDFKDGLNKLGDVVIDGYVLLSSVEKISGNSIIKLLDLNKNIVIHSWRVNFKHLKKIYKSDSLKNLDDKRIRMFHPILTSDSSIIFNTFDGVFKLDKNSNFNWSNVDNSFHHSIELDGEGYLWVPSMLNRNETLKSNSNFKKMPFFRDDAIAKLDPETGKLVFIKSIFTILIENGYRSLVIGTGFFEIDPIHVNDIQPALYDGDFWKKGDLLISIKHKSTVFLYRPSNDKIVWLKTGPWLNQHDCDFVGSSKIAVFGNDVFRTLSGDFVVDSSNNQYIYDFRLNKTVTPFDTLFKKLSINSIYGGRSDLINNNLIFIEETSNGRIIIGNHKNALATYADRLDSQHIAILAWSRYYTKDEINKLFTKK